MAHPQTLHLPRYPLPRNSTAFYAIFLSIFLGEAILSQAFRNHLKDSKHNFDTHMIVFDYHRHCSGSGKQENLKGLLQKAKPSIENFQFFSLLNGEVVK